MHIKYQVVILLLLFIFYTWYSFSPPNKNEKKYDLEFIKNSMAIVEVLLELTVVLFTLNSIK